MDQKIANVYFIGIGGIGMSAIARYWLLEGARVGGYDRTGTPLTRALAAEGADIHYEDDPGCIGPAFRDPAATLVIYTPAVPADHRELQWFRNNGFRVMKRSQALGVLSEDKYVMAVAGTHGKTTTTTLTAWLSHTAGDGGSAFLGGISKNFGSNFVHGPGRRLAVEADEFDRSFLHLSPDAAVITSMDADHLDIYGTHDELRRAFGEFAGRIRRGGTLVIKKGLELPLDRRDVERFTYHCTDPLADFHAEELRVDPDGTYRFDLVCPDRRVTGCHLGIPGIVNVENAVAAAALSWTAGFDEDGLRRGLESFAGVRRRFDFHINTPALAYMDDYAHHPAELRAALVSLRGMFPGRRIVAAFQPHLYTRTRDFYREFAESLSLADEVILIPIYPAREEPIEGVSSAMIADLLTVPHRLAEADELAEAMADAVSRAGCGVAVTFGAGNIDTRVEAVAGRLRAELKGDR